MLNLPYVYIWPVTLVWAIRKGCYKETVWCTFFIGMITSATVKGRFMMTFSRNLMTWQNPHKVINTTCTKGLITSISSRARLLITFAISLDQDQDRQNVGPDLDPNYLTLWWYFWKNFSKKVDFEKSADDNKSMKNYLVGKELKLWYLPKCQRNVSALIFYSIVFQEMIKSK